MDLKEVIRLHLMWLRDEDGGKRADLVEADLRRADLVEADLRRADLGGANLEGADLGGANLRRANLGGANLEGADLEGADLDYAAWPLWCGSFDAKADRRLAAQLAYHFCRIDFGDDAVCLVAQDALVTLANEFHRVGECGIPPIQQRGSPKRGAVRMPDERDMPDIDNLQTVEDVIAWLRGASTTCAETAKHNRDIPDHAIYLRGRAEAFGLAAGLLEDAIREDADE